MLIWRTPVPGRGVNQNPASPPPQAESPLPNVHLFAQPNSARICSWFLALTELTRRKVGPGRMVTLPSRKATQIGGPTFCSHVSGSHPRFVRKCEKSWLTQGISGRLVTLLPWTTFLHINRALISSPDDVTGSWPFLQQRFPWYSHQVLFPLAPPYLFHIVMTASY